MVVLHLITWQPKEVIYFKLLLFFFPQEENKYIWLVIKIRAYQIDGALDIAFIEIALGKVT